MKCFLFQIFMKVCAIFFSTKLTYFSLFGQGLVMIFIEKQAEGSSCVENGWYQHWIKKTKVICRHRSGNCLQWCNNTKQRSTFLHCIENEYTNFSTGFQKSRDIIFWSWLHNILAIINRDVFAPCFRFCLLPITFLIRDLHVLWMTQQYSQRFFSFSLKLRYWNAACWAWTACLHVWPVNGQSFFPFRSDFMIFANI